MADTLADVKARDTLNCGVNTGLVGFAAPDANGNWQGFDIAVCKAVAAAVLGDATKVKYVPTTGQTRFTALSSGEVDMMARNSTWSFQRDTGLGSISGNQILRVRLMVRRAGRAGQGMGTAPPYASRPGTSTDDLDDWFKATPELSRGHRQKRFCEGRTA